MDVRSWLEELGLGEYREAFERNAIDRETLLELSDAELESLGVSALGHRKKLLRAIAALRGGAEVPSTAQAAPLPSPIEPDLSQLPSVLALPLHEYFVESDPVLRLWHACDSVELCLRLVVGLGVADLRRSGELPAGLLTELRPRIEEPTLGKWRGMAQAVVRHSALPGAAFPELRGFVEEVLVPLLDGPGGMRTAETSLSSLRNQLAHGGGVTRAAAAKLLAAWGERFETAFARLGWLKDVALLVRFQGSLGVLRGPTTQPQAYQPVEEFRHSLQDAFRHGNEVAVVRGDVVAGLWPLALYGTPRSPGEAEASAQTPVPQVFVRRGDVGLQMTPVGSEEVCQSEAGQTALDAFLAFFRVDEREPEHKGKALTVPGFEKEIAREAARLMGRTAELAHVRETVENATEGVLWLTGPAGSGKSVLISRVATELLERPSVKALVLPYRFRAGDGRCSRESFLRFAIERLERELAPDPADEKAKPIDRVKQLLSGLGDRRVIFVLDGLDEVADRDARFAEEVPLSLGLPGVIWLCAGRPERGLPEAFSSAGARVLFSGDGLPPMNEGDIRTMLLENVGLQRRRLLLNDREQSGLVTNPFVEKVAKCADGLPLYVTYVIGDVLSNRLRALDAGEKLPPSLDLYHEELLQRCGLGPLRTVLTPLAGLLTVAREPLGPEALTAVLDRWLGIGAEDDPLGLVRKALSAIGSMLRRSETPEGTEGYTLYHHSLRQHMLASPHFKGTMATARKHLADLALDPGTLAQKAATYLYRNGVTHLLEAGRRNDALGVLTSFAYLMGRLRTVRDPGGIEGLLADWRTVDNGTPDPSHEIWSDFFRSYGHILRRGNSYWPSYKILLQLATEHADESPITRHAESWLAQRNLDWTWLRSLRRPSRVAPSPRKSVLEGFSDWAGIELGGVAALPDGGIVAWQVPTVSRRFLGDHQIDRALRIWDTESGQLRHTLIGHTDIVRGATPLAPGRLLSWSDDRTLRVWDLDAGNCLTVFTGHLDAVIGALVLASGEVLSWAWDNTLRTWDPKSGVCRAVMEGHSGYIRGALDLPSGEVLSRSDDRTLRVWDPTKGTCSAVLKGHRSLITDALVTSNGDVLSRSDDHTLRLWDRKSGKCRAILKSTFGPFFGTLPLPTGEILTWSKGDSLEIWNPDSETCRITLRGHADCVIDATLLESGEVLSWSADKTLRLWDPISGDCRRIFSGHSERIAGALSLSGGTIVSWENPGANLRVWDAALGQCRSTVDCGIGYIAGAGKLPSGEVLVWSRSSRLAVLDPKLSKGSSAVHKPEVNALDALVLSAGDVLFKRGNRAEIWDSRDASCRVVLQGHSDSVDGALKLPDGDILTWSSDRSLRIWDSFSGTCRVSLEGHSARIMSAMVLPNMEVLSWSEDGTLRIWNRADGTCRLAFKAPTAKCKISSIVSECAVYGCAPFDSSGRIVSWYSDDIIRIWDTTSGDLWSTLKGHAAKVCGVVVHSNDRVTSWSLDNTLRVWEVPSGKCLAVLDGHSDWINGALVLPNSEIVSWSSDKSLRIWNCKTGRCRSVLAGHACPVHGAAILPDMRLASWSPDDQSLLVWNLGSAECEEVLSWEEVAFSRPSLAMTAWNSGANRCGGVLLPSPRRFSVLFCNSFEAAAWHPPDKALVYGGWFSDTDRLLALLGNGMRFLQVMSSAKPLVGG